MTHAGRLGAPGNHEVCRPTDALTRCPVLRPNQMFDPQEYVSACICSRFIQHVGARESRDSRVGSRAVSTAQVPGAAAWRPVRLAVSSTAKWHAVPRVAIAGLSPGGGAARSSLVGAHQIVLREGAAGGRDREDPENSRSCRGNIPTTMVGPGSKCGCGSACENDGVAGAELEQHITRPGWGAGGVELEDLHDGRAGLS